MDSLEIAVPVSLGELALIGDAIGQAAAIVQEGSAASELSGEIVRQAAVLNERTRLGTLFIAADESESLVLGEFVGVEIVGRDAPQTYRVPAASLTSRDQVWVVNDGQLEDRQVEVLGSENNLVVVKAFDIADGIVMVPPADVRAGLTVTMQLERSLASTDGGAAAGGE